MGAVNFSIDLGLVTALKTVLPIDVFVESGTFRGDTVDLVKDLFREIHSVELSPEYFEEAISRFAGQEQIHLIHQDSAAALADLAPGLHHRSVLYFLDAHWCVAANTAGATSQCPLLAEIRAIDKLNPESLVIIDDARFFLAPPPAPHEISQWPGLHEVLAALRGLSNTHLAMVVNDCILFYPGKVSEVVKGYAHEFGVDWLTVYNTYRDHQDLAIRLEEKENAIKVLDSDCRDLKADCDAKDEEIKGLKSDCDAKDEEIKALEQVCAEREKVIFVLDERVKFLERTNIIGKVLVLARSMIRMAVSVFKQKVESWLAPRLGNLRQYPPRPLRLAGGNAQQKIAGNPPKISVVTPSYNQAVYLERTIRSVVEQDYPNMEYVVQDGGSQDGSVEILERYADRLAHWESAPDKGQTNAINLGFRHVNGEIMAYLNSDDVLLPGALAYVAAYFEAHPEVDAVYGHRIIIDENDQEIGRWIMPPHDNEVLSWADFIPQETLFWRRRLWDKIGGALDESFHFAMDWDMLLRMRDAGAKFVRLPKFIAAFRVHSQQKTSAEIGDIGFKEMGRLRERCHGRSVSPEEIRKGVAMYIVRHIIHDKLYGR